MAEQEEKDVLVISHDELVTKMNERLMLANITCAKRMEEMSFAIVRNTSDMRKIAAGNFASEDMKNQIIQQIVTSTQMAKPGQTLVFDLNITVDDGMKGLLNFELHEGMCDVRLKVFNIGTKSSVTVTVLDNI